MSEFLKFLREIFQDGGGYYSSKRIVAIAAFVFIVVCGVANLVAGLVIAEFIFDGFMWIVLGGLGVTLGENVAGLLKERVVAPR